MKRGDTIAARMENELINLQEEPKLSLNAAREQLYFSLVCSIVSMRRSRVNAR